MWCQGCRILYRDISRDFSRNFSKGGGGEIDRKARSRPHKSMRPRACVVAGLTVEVSRYVYTNMDVGCCCAYNICAACTFRRGESSHEGGGESAPLALCIGIGTGGVRCAIAPPHF